jgi:peptidoglycan/LPS O-acetylase OafA/YrhL
VPAISSERRIPQLDGIRGIAVSMVVLFHYFGGNDDQSIIANKGIRWLFNRGWSGVDLFFILSGFLIGGILLDNEVNRRFASVFYYRRFLRIFPLYYLLLLIAWLAAGSLPDRWWVYPLYLQNVPMALDYKIPDLLGITWSLAVEEHFYLILPVLIAALTWPQLARAIGLVALFAVALRFGGFLVGWTHAKSFAYYFTFCRMDDLMLGVGAALAVRNASVRAMLGRSVIPLYLVLIACFALLPVISRFDLLYPWTNLTIGVIIYATLYISVLLLAVCHPNSTVAWITQLQALRWLGQRAYSIYLFHLTTFALAEWIVPATSLYAAYANRMLALFAVIGLAWLLWRFVEKPLISMGHRAKYGGSATGKSLAKTSGND